LNIINGIDGFYDAGYTTGSHVSNYVTYDADTLFYKVLGSNVDTVQIVDLSSDMLAAMAADINTSQSE
jgi:hypothetical protein